MTSLQFIGEFIGTAILLFMGNAVVANVLLNKTKGKDAGLLVIAIGWAIAVFLAVIFAGKFSGAHLNPVVTLVLFFKSGSTITSLQLFGYIIAQFFGAFIGQSLVYLFYRDHYKSTTDNSIIKATFCTSPAIKNTFNNFLSEFIGTFILILSILYFQLPEVKIGSIDAIPVSLAVLGIGLSLGGTTGYAINPARDLSPRLLYGIIYGFKNANWKYAWIPAIAPICGGLTALLLYIFVK